ncbi:MAG: hypothetical protein JSU81_06970 [Candidatus Coatesbacteria bacterium]|nr:MAG: hypothetical protein JSU81_06970 [Candidatus Coatesbacteria bacterium]
MTLKKIAVVFVLAVLAALAVLQIWYRPIDRDEGFWLYTAWRLASGELPYRDFALPHLPLAPLYYAASVKLFGPSLYGARALNVALFLGAAALLGVAAARRSGREAGIATAVLFTSSSLALTWLVPAKAYAPAVAPLAAAVAVWIWPGRAETIGWVRAAAVGALLGVATMARLTVAVTLGATILGVWFAVPGRPGKRLRLEVATCLGFLAVMPLLLYFRAAAGEAFAFNVWGIHRLFLEAPAAGRGAAALSLLLPPDPAILAGLAVVALAAGNGRIWVFPVAAGALILLANFAPGTSQQQYFVPAVAAFAPAAGAGAAALYRKRKWIAVFLVAVAALLGAARPAAKVAFDRAHKKLVGPAEVYAASRLLAENSAADETVFTAWPGYAALAQRRLMADWELGYFTHRIGERLSAAERRRYHLATYEETAARLAAGEVRTVLDGVDTPQELRPVIDRHFEAVESRRGVTVWRYKNP